MCLQKPTPTIRTLRTRRSLVPFVEPRSLSTFYFLWFVVHEFLELTPASTVRTIIQITHTHTHAHLQGIKDNYKTREMILHKPHRVQMNSSVIPPPELYMFTRQKEGVYIYFLLFCILSHTIKPHKVNA